MIYDPAYWHDRRGTGLVHRIRVEFGVSPARTLCGADAHVGETYVMRKGSHEKVTCARCAELEPGGP